MPIENSFHSEEVQSILGKAPSWVVRWGVTIVFIIFCGLFLGCYFIKYPDIITCQAQITTYNPPADLISRYDGLIDTLCVKDGDMVQTGDLIAVLSNTATWTDVDYIQKQLNDFSLFDHSQSIQKEWINKEYSLGDLQSTFAIFQKSCTDYNHYISTNYIQKKKYLIKEQIIKNTEYFNIIKSQCDLKNKDLEIQRNSFKRDSILYGQKVISSNELDIATQNLIQKQNYHSDFNSSLSLTELQIIQLEQQIVELSIQHENETSEYERQITQSYQQLIAEIAKWKQLYTLTASISGNITFVKYWNKNQYINVGAKVASIIPTNDARIIGRIQIPSVGFGKVQVGQNVNIKLNGFPYMEFGV